MDNGGAAPWKGNVVERDIDCKVGGRYSQIMVKKGN